MKILDLILKLNMKLKQFSFNEKVLTVEDDREVKKREREIWRIDLKPGRNKLVGREKKEGRKMVYRGVDEYASSLCNDKYRWPLANKQCIQWKLGEAFKNFISVCLLHLFSLLAVCINQVSWPPAVCDITFKYNSMFFKLLNFLFIYFGFCLNSF